MIDSVENFCPLKNVGILSFIELIRSFIRCWKEQNLFITNKILKIIVEVGGFFLVVHYENAGLLIQLINRCCYHGIETSYQTF